MQCVEHQNIVISHSHGCLSMCWCRFAQVHGRYPGAYEHDVEDELPLLKACGQQVLGELGAGAAQLQDDYAAEMCRWVNSAAGWTSAWRRGRFEHARCCLDGLMALGPLTA
jgi:hypothetical protein